jgi:hypothetical protein
MLSLEAVALIDRSEPAAADQVAHNALYRLPASIILVAASCEDRLDVRSVPQSTLDRPWRARHPTSCCGAESDRYSGPDSLG